MSDQGDFPMADETDFGNIPFDDEEDAVRPTAGRESSINMSIQQDDSLSHNGGLSVGGLDVSNDTAVATPPKSRKRASVGPKKMRKRRKVVIDNENTELSNQHIKNMLADTSDIVQHRMHPSAWIPGQEASTHTRSDKDLLFAYLSYEKLFTRPALGDDGQLAPELLQLWAKNTAPILGKPFPYRMRQDADESMEEDEDIEIARQQRQSVGGEGEPVREEEDENDFPPPDDQDEFPREEDEPMVWDDDAAPPQDESGFANDMDGMDKSPASQRSRQSILSLGIANDLENDIVGDDEEDPRQEAGDSAVSSMGKWHKHTVKVYSMLKDNMAVPGEDEAGEEPKPGQMSYDKLSTGCSRRTAAGVFFELLQLKTWDYIDLDQDESYGDIKVSYCRMLFVIYIWTSKYLILSLSILHNRSCRV
jgi:cohesin complex subunit SCC1